MKNEPRGDKVSLRKRLADWATTRTREWLGAPSVGAPQDGEGYDPERDLERLMAVLNSTSDESGLHFHH